MRKLHTRDMTRLSQIQVADYLKRSDEYMNKVLMQKFGKIVPGSR